MFTGIIEQRGRIKSITSRGPTLSWVIEAQPAFEDTLVLGESIAIAGVCLTVTDFSNSTFSVDISQETLERTCLGEKKVGEELNLERSLRLGDRMGGHFVSGHVDCVGVVHRWDQQDGFVLAEISLPKHAESLCVEKGSVTVDGVSLTINKAHDHQGQNLAIELCLIPHTLEQTTLKMLRPQSRVNIEYDLIARYVKAAVTVHEHNR